MTIEPLHELNMSGSRFGLSVSNFRRHMEAPEVIKFNLSNPFLGLVVNLGNSFDYTCKTVTRGNFEKNRYNLVSLPTGDYEINFTNGLQHVIVVEVTSWLLGKYSHDFPFLKPLIEAAKGAVLYSIRADHVAISPLLDSDIHSLLHHASSDQELRDLLIEVKAFDVVFDSINDLAMLATALPGGDPGYSNIMKVAAFLVDHLSENFNLEDLCDRFNISKRNLQMGFKKNFRKTVHEFVVHRRMDAAKKMLRNKSLSVKNIANAVGYKDVSSFSCAYKKFYNQFPTAVRDTPESDTQGILL